MEIKSKKIIIGVTASIAIYKTLVLIRHLKELGCQCKVVMTENAAKLISPQVFEAISEQKVLTNEFHENRETPMDHISMKNWGDILLVYPATANCIGQMASGIAPSLLTTIYLAFKGPVILAPAMNPDMYSHPIVQDNLEKLGKFGVEVLEPGLGLLACNEEGLGRLQEPEAVIEYLKANSYLL